MGLDMYLTKKLYVGGNYKHREVEGDLTFTIKGEKVVIPIKKVSQIELHAGYWRKANQIHNWFVHNVQGSEDNCRESYVSKEQLQELKNLCQDVLNNADLAEELLPTEQGFFFGSYDYDEGYFQDLEDTITIIDEALADSDDYDFYYQASW